MKTKIEELYKVYKEKMIKSNNGSSYVAYKEMTEDILRLLRELDYED